MKNAAKCGFTAQNISSNVLLQTTEIIVALVQSWPPPSEVVRENQSVRRSEPTTTLWSRERKMLWCPRTRTGPIVSEVRRTKLVLRSILWYHFSNFEHFLRAEIMMTSLASLCESKSMPGECCVLIVHRKWVNVGTIGQVLAFCVFWIQLIMFYMACMGFHIYIYTRRPMNIWIWWCTVQHSLHCFATIRSNPDMVVSTVK